MDRKALININTLNDLESVDDRIMQRMNVLRSLKPSWYDKNVRVPSAQTFDNVEDVLHDVADKLSPNWIVAPSVEGEIILEWQGFFGASFVDDKAEVWLPEAEEGTFIFPKQHRDFCDLVLRIVG